MIENLSKLQILSAVFFVLSKIINIATIILIFSSMVMSSLYLYAKISLGTGIFFLLLSMVVVIVDYMRPDDKMNEVDKILSDPETRRLVIEALQYEGEK